MVFIGISAVAVNLSTTAASSPLKGSLALNPRGLPLARTHPYLSYDEQAGATFTQDFTSLAFNVSAIAQTGPDGVGPAYLLNGLTNAGYWYQVGLSWKWPSGNSVPLAGFNMNFEVFDQYGISVFPVNGGGGIDSIQVNEGDLVLLDLNFLGTDVLMQTTDWNTTSGTSEYYPSFGASYFMGLPNAVSSSGFFSGLMTEEYHSSPYEGNVQPVVYQENNFNRTSAWLWVDEFNTNTFQPVFSDNTTSPISVDNASLLQYFSFHGMAEAISTQEFITGLLPIQAPLLRASTSSTSHPGEQITITLDIQNPNNIAITVKSLIISTQFGVFDVSSSALSFPMTGNSTFTTSIAIPTSVLAGNYTLTSIADWQFNPQLMENIGSDPLQANTTIAINGAANPANPHPSTPPPSSTPPSTATANPLLTLLRTVLLPVLFAYAGAMALVVALVIRRERQQILLPPVASAPFCRVCGSRVGQTMHFCPNCGSSLTSPSDPATLSANPEPPSSP